MHLKAIRHEHGGSASRMTETLILAGEPLAEIEALKRRPWEGLVERSAAAREDLGVTPRQPVARYFLLCGRPTLTHTPAKMRRLLLLGLEAGSLEEEAWEDHGEEEQP